MLETSQFRVDCSDLEENPKQCASTDAAKKQRRQTNPPPHHPTGTERTRSPTARAHGAYLRERLESLLLSLEILGLFRNLGAQRALVRIELGAHATLLRDSVNHLVDAPRDE